MTIRLAKPGSTVKSNLSPPQCKDHFITCTILEAYQYYHGYVINTDAKNCATYGDML